MARWPLLLSLSIHVLLGLVVMRLTIFSDTQIRPNVIFINIIEEKKIQIIEERVLETKIKPKTLPKKKEEKETPLPTKVEERINLPLEGFHQESRKVEEAKEEDRTEKQENPEKPEPQEAMKNYQETEKQGESDAPVQGTKASTLPLEAPSPEPGTVPGFKGTTWLGEMQGSGGEGAEGKNIVEGKKSGMEPAGARGGETSGSSKGKKNHGDLRAYVETTRMKIEKAKRYPIEARRKKWEGKVVLSFKINRHGEVLEINLIQSSGYRLLDDEGIITLRRASPFPSPLAIEKENLLLEVPILFKLERNM